MLFNQQKVKTRESGYSSCGNVYEVIIAVMTGYYLYDFWVVAKTWKGEQLVSFKKAGSLKIYFNVQSSATVLYIKLI